MIRSFCFPLVVALVGVITLSVSARVIAPASIADRVANNPVVVLGTVTSIEDKTVLHDGAEYKIAVLKINEAFKGAKELTHLRIVFQPTARFPANSMQKDLDVLLFLHPVKGQTFHATRMYYDIVNKNSPQWAREVAATRKCAQALANVDKWLAAGNPEERFLAAAMQIIQARPQRVVTAPGPNLDAARTKAVLLALAEADWKQADPDGPLGPLGARNLFARLNPAPTDGWMPPADVQSFDAAAKKWLKVNADTFVFKTLVPREE